VSVGGLLALDYGRLQVLRKEEQSMNCAERTLIEIGLKSLKKQKRRKKVRESKSLNEKTEEDKSTRNMDHGQLNKNKNPPIDDLVHLTRKKER
jgi:hypothetical protein